jgi:hypothetical protein
MSNQHPNFEDATLEAKRHLQEVISNSSDTLSSKLEQVDDSEVGSSSSEVKDSSQTRETITDLRNQVFQDLSRKSQGNNLPNNSLRQKNAPKDEHIASWLMAIPEEERVEKSIKLIRSNAKSIVEILDAFLRIEDFKNLDEIGSLLSDEIEELIDKHILHKIK